MDDRSRMRARTGNGLQVPSIIVFMDGGASPEGFIDLVGMLNCQVFSSFRARPQRTCAQTHPEQSESTFQTCTPARTLQNRLVFKLARVIIGACSLLALHGRLTRVLEAAVNNNS